MSESITITAEVREDVGKGASRRLRHEGKVPAVIYGGHRDPANLSLDQNELLHAADNEAFYASVIELSVTDGRSQSVVVRDMQRHPFKAMVMHIDFMRVSATETLKISVPVHFVGEEESPAGKAAGVIIQHQITEVEIEALPANIPEYLEADLSEMDAGDVVKLSELKLPEGVIITALAIEDEDHDHDATVANAVHIKADQGTGAAAAAEAAEAEDELGAVEAEGEEGEEGEESDEEDKDAAEE